MMSLASSARVLQHCCAYRSVNLVVARQYAKLHAAHRLRGLVSTKEVIQMLKKLKLVFVTTALLVGGVAGIAAAQGRGPDKHRGRDKDRKAEKRAMHDARATARFTSLDTNKDGVLSLAEFKAGKQQGGRHHGRKSHGKHRGIGRGQP